MEIVDLTVPIGEETLSPPSVNLQLKMTSYHRGPGFWQASKVEMLLHTGSHVDFLRHVQKDGETAVDVDLERVFGKAVLQYESGDPQGKRSCWLKLEIIF